MPTHFTFKAIGTTWNIDIEDDLPEKEKLLGEIMSRIDIFDKTYSRFRSDSLVTEISRKSGNYYLPDDAEKMFSLYKRLYDITKGKMSPLVGQVLSDAGYDSKYSLRPKENVSPAPTWKESIEYKHLVLVVKKPVLLDFGAAGKGYLIDIVSDIVAAHGIKNYTVDAGGDIRYENENKKVIRVGLENPENFKQVVGVANITGGSICGSSGNRRRWGNRHHIIDPRTAKSPEHILALWTVAKNTILADAISTALFFVEPEVLAKEFDFEYAILYKDSAPSVSKSFPGSFFETEKVL